MITPTHFHDFKPCDTVQYDWPHDANEAHYDAVFDKIVAMLGPKFGVASIECILHIDTFEAPRGIAIATATPGQWLVKQGNHVWVQDHEPARVIEWQHRVVRSRSGGVFWEDSLDAAQITQRIDGGIIKRRPVLSNGWTGPWEEA